jgi:hypothetical protein
MAGWLLSKKKKWGRVDQMNQINSPIKQEKQIICPSNLVCMYLLGLVYLSPQCIVDLVGTGSNEFVYLYIQHRVIVLFSAIGTF